MKVFMYTIITTMVTISYFETSPVAGNEVVSSTVVKFSIILYVLKCIIFVFTIGEMSLIPICIDSLWLYLLAPRLVTV